MNAATPTTLESDDLLELLDVIEQPDDEVRSSTGSYLNEIGLIPLLDAEDEWSLSERIHEGDADADENLLVVVFLVDTEGGQRRGQHQ